MSYTSPRTWVAGELVDQSEFNIHIRDNLIALKDPESATYILNESSDYTTSGTSFGNVDATAGKLSLSITLAVQADVFIFFTGAVENSGANTMNFDVTMDGSRLGGDDGLQVVKVAATTATPVHFTFVKESVAAGSHTFNLQWKVSAGTGTLYAGAGTGGNKDVHPQYIVREIS